MNSKIEQINKKLLRKSDEIPTVVILSDLLKYLKSLSKEDLESHILAIRTYGDYVTIMQIMKA